MARQRGLTDPSAEQASLLAPLANCLLPAECTDCTLSALTDRGQR